MTLPEATLLKLEPMEAIDVEIFSGPDIEMLTAYECYEDFEDMNATRAFERRLAWETLIITVVLLFFRFFVFFVF